MVVYIAGPMTGIEGYNRKAFKRAENEITALGYTALNPAWLPTTMEYTRYMPICIAMLEAADAIYLLDGWEKSAGAKVEHAYAIYQGKSIMNASTEQRSPDNYVGEAAVEYGCPFD